MFLPFIEKHVLPACCIVCGQNGDLVRGLCPGCIDQLRPLPFPLCEVCGRPVGTKGQCIDCQVAPPAYDRMVSAVCFEGIIRDIVHSFKYGRKTFYKGLLASLLLDILAEGDYPDFDVMTFVPMHWTRLLNRGFNQSAVLAREMSGHMGIDVRYDILRKTRRTRAQAGLGRTERSGNVKGAFSAGNVKDKSVLVVDDVITTGHTAAEVSAALKKAGARYVLFASVGRVVS